MELYEVSSEWPVVECEVGGVKVAMFREPRITELMVAPGSASTNSAMDAMRRLGVTIDHCHDKDACVKQVVGIINGYRAAQRQ